MIKDSKSNAEFPLAQKFWEGEEMRCLGAGTRVKKVLVVGVQAMTRLRRQRPAGRPSPAARLFAVPVSGVRVYSVAVYVEAERCSKELGIRARGGFFENDGDFCAALLDGAFGKALVFKLLRDITGQQFAEAIDEALAPRAKVTGDSASLQQFGQFFASRQLPKDTQVAFVWPLKGGEAGELQAEVVLPGEAKDLVTTAPELRIPSPGLARALFELYLGDSSVVPEGRPAWAAGARELLDYDAVKRDTRKAGA
ncbi:chalcone-flavanone isomerase [Monoraphidium neglectum]|uniref:Chalcone-flavanone isomerase n=1 Tax=Monoraphidium neglectum TaxID=145388 RepID=A0A0D2M2D8_9CHLO|nr:chalcone-flavanone isomerase [Monoraphidium neglectum]KIY97814.1 chalcone-flavanone isomerase [Monoraphidium neglectum]|eukprot:XP_013896834.1 chalcone-flavanone isomerase [Monoraphidium neglectum]